MNTITLVGHLGQAPEITTVGEGRHVAKLSLATTRSWKNAAGNIEEQTQWHRVVVWGGWVDAIREAEKGSKVMVVGEMKYSSYDGKDGEKVYTAEVHAFQCGLMVKSNRSGAATSGWGGK